MLKLNLTSADAHGCTDVTGFGLHRARAARWPWPAE